MSAKLNVGIGEVPDNSFGENVVVVSLCTESREVELFVSDFVDNAGSNDFLDEVGKCFNEAILWRKELLYVPEIVLDDTVLDFAEELSDGLSREVYKLQKEAE